MTTYYCEQKMDTLFAAVILGLCVAIAQSQSALAPCTRIPQPPETRSSRTSGDSGYAITIAGRPAPEGYIPGQVYTVTLNGTYQSKKFAGFYLVAVPKNAVDETTTLGTFQHFPNPALTKFSEDCPHILTHTYSLLKDGVSVLWTAPPTGSGCVEFRATVIENMDVWYKDDGALTKAFCEDESAPAPVEESVEISDCCACGVAKYHMVFMGNWSRHTHPKDFPTFQHLLHWSNIVGATHSKDYMLWRYGGMASTGVKEVCEYGYPRVMEKEIKEHGGSVRTVIKTPGIWGNLRETRWARFTVNRTHHLMSVLTMIGPSPDWCVGLSGLDLCRADCTWAGDQTIELYPWDAGTDSGITYMAKNSPTVPAEPIRRITNEYPKDPRSPFFGSEDLKPVATLVIKRLHPKTASECVEDAVLPEEPVEPAQPPDEDVSPEDMAKMKAKMSGKCVTSDWSEWSACSVTCSVGVKVRQRHFLMPGITGDMCPPMDLMEKENCIGLENACDYSELCSASAWSEWSPCSVTCGKGARVRSRFLIRKEEKPQCGHLDFENEESCVLISCAEIEATMNFTKICALPKLVGRCRGSFLKWYWDTNMRKCLPFHYGGCRGNENRFATREKCELLCRDVLKPQRAISDESASASLGGHTTRQILQPDEPLPNVNDVINQISVVRDPVDCMVTQWSGWSSCSRTCGKGYTTQSRIIKRPASNGGEACPRRLLKRKRCRIQKCPTDCTLGDWSTWEACTQTCGEGSVQTRIRQVVQRPKNGGRACDARLERRYCSLPLCPGQTVTMSPESRYTKYMMADPPLWMRQDTDPE